jgi:hypothetical protein
MELYPRESGNLPSAGAERNFQDHEELIIPIISVQGKSSCAAHLRVCAAESYHQLLYRSVRIFFCVPFDDD